MTRKNLHAMALLGLALAAPARGQPIYTAQIGSNCCGHICTSHDGTVTGAAPVANNPACCTNFQDSFFCAESSADQHTVQASCSVIPGAGATGTANKQAYAAVVFDDLVFSRTTGAPGPIQFTFTARVDVPISVAAGYTAYAAINSAVPATVQQSGGPPTSAILVSNVGTANLDSPMIVQFDIGAQCGYGGIDARLDFAYGPVFNLPAGYTANCPSAGIVNNLFTDVTVVDENTAQSFLDDLERLHGCVVMEGALRTDLSLPGLLQLGNCLSVSCNPSLTSLSVPVLQSLGGDLEVMDNPDLEVIDAGEIGEVGGDVDVSGNTAVTTIDVGSLTSSGDFNMSGNMSVTTIDVGSLTSSGDFNMSGNASVTTIDVGLLTSSGDFNMNGNTAVTTIDVGALTSSGDFTMNGNTAVTTIDVGSLTNSGGDVNVSCNDLLQEVGLGSLTETGGGIDISGNAGASTIDLGALTGTGGGISISGNEGASTIDLDALTQTGGGIDISGNAGASTINLGALTGTGGGISISGNEGASTIDLDALTQTGGGIDISGNAGASTINLGALTGTGGGISISGNEGASTIDLASLQSVGLSEPSLAQSVHVVAPSPLVSDHLGHAVAVSGDTIVATAPGADLPGMADAGAAYISTRTSGVWSAPAPITAGGFAGAAFGFGQCAALDGDTLMIGSRDQLGAPGQTYGAVYVFTRSGGVWGTTPAQQLLSPDASPPINDYFGNAVAISGDLAAVGEYLDSADGPDALAYGAVHIFRRIAGVWASVQTIRNPEATPLGRFGEALALDGTTLLVGAPGADRSLCRTNVGAVWAYELSANGASVLGSARLALPNGNANDQFGQVVALDGDTAMVGMVLADAPCVPGSGAVYVLTRASGSGAAGWTLTDRLTPPSPQSGMQFGASVALAGASALIGAPHFPGGPGTAHLFMRNANGIWIHWDETSGSDSATGDAYGSAVAFDGQTAAVGARLDDVNLQADAGSVYVEALTIGGGGLSVCDNTSATTIMLQSLSTVAGAVNICGNTSVTTIDVGSLTNSGDFIMSGNTAVTTIDVGLLTNSGDFTMNGNTAVTTIDVGSLTNSGDFTMSGNTSVTTIDVGSLTSSGDFIMSGNTAVTTIDVGLLTNSGDFTMNGNTAVTTIDVGSLTNSGDVAVTGNSSATSLNTNSLQTVGGDLTIIDNPLLSPISFPALVSVSGSVTLEAQQQTTVDFVGVSIGGNLDMSASGASNVSADSPAGQTHLGLHNDGTQMDLTIPTAALEDGTPMAVTRLEPASLPPTAGLDASGAPAQIDALAAYHFDLGAAPLAAAAALSFELTVANLSPGEQSQVLAALTSGALTLAVTSDAPGSVPIALPICLGRGCTPPTLTVTALDGFHQPLPPGSPEIPSYVLLETNVTQFSTYAAAIVIHPGDANCDGLLTEADIEPMAQALVDPEAYATAYTGCYGYDLDFNGDLVIDGLDLQGFVEAVVP